MPRNDSVNGDARFRGPASYARDTAHLRARACLIFDAYFTMVRQISAAITHRIGAIG
jgi:hypothetical protein